MLPGVGGTNRRSIRRCRESEPKPLNRIDLQVQQVLRPGRRGNACGALNVEKLHPVRDLHPLVRTYAHDALRHDAARDDRYPVDGGVFDVPAGRDEVLVAVEPRLPVSRAVGFTVTVERPGGAVVSTREKVVAVVKLDR